MSKIKCIIIEDEPLAAKVLKDYVSEVHFLQLQGVFKDAILAAEFLMKNETDLIFLDIHLPKLKGMAFLRTLANPPAVIVTTAYHQYAVEGFNLNVTDYLLKPFEFERFFTAVNKVNTDFNRKLADPRDFIFVNVQKRKVKIPFAEILYIESQKEYIKIVTTKAEYLSKMSTTEMEDLLPAHIFKRIHRSFIVSVHQIDAYTAEMVEIKGITIPVGRGYKDVIDKL
ncbi:DNA-binding LytR/AlgR family response regulator [Chitinophaga dinghuensis]|uniref:DNA-binding LytR/AlgR family response regulator n=1 Tax=Chitinophaga dinghuensis TaxID=1539050 RepID=A0A327VQN1_9BACT|nr:LytTR family DNA-binding domain-containing protein [Chitinophaga dinghuensis]RAJ75697.1 DNA-binding LytR/AlgR family response regulator [Chitinophaga dinghuensis]